MRFVYIFITLCLWATAALAAPKHVVILGGGVAGMTAAQELSERGFKVSVYEYKSIAGGKARSIGVPESGREGKADLPGEHGFRFFPGFYRHITNTMSRIPYGRNANGVLDNLVEVPSMHVATNDGSRLLMPVSPPKSLKEFIAAVRFVYGSLALGIPAHELVYFANRLYVLATASDERRLGEFEKISWWEFIGAGARSPQYQKYLATGLMRNLVAARPEQISARTGGSILLQLTYNMLGMGEHVDRVLAGPTNEVWIDPWLLYLRQLGVEYNTEAKVEAIHYSGGKVTGATVSSGGKIFEIAGDYYIAAMPVEVVTGLVSGEMLAAAPELGRLPRLKTEWMTGIQYFFSKDIPIARAHSIYFDSPWALTSLSQKQFWTKSDLANYGDGTVRGVISIDISEWDKAGILYGKPARECTAEEIKNEVLAQMKRHLDPETAQSLDRHLVTWFLDPAITFPESGKAANSEPLLVNTVGSWFNRPTAITHIPNFFLAADYVQTFTDLATMESANEAARRAVNGILLTSGWRARPVDVWPLREPVLFKAERAIDRLRYRLGLPHWVDRLNWCMDLLLRKAKLRRG